MLMDPDAETVDHLDVAVIGLSDSAYQPVPDAVLAPATGSGCSRSCMAYSADRFRILSIVFVALDVRFDELSRDQSDGVTLSLARPAVGRQPVHVGAEAGDDEAGWVEFLVGGGRCGPWREFEQPGLSQKLTVRYSGSLQIGGFDRHEPGIQEESMHARRPCMRLSANQEIGAHSLGEVRSFLEELKHGTTKYKTIASLSGQIAEAYRGRCVLELLQNAQDALTESLADDPGRSRSCWKPGRARYFLLPTVVTRLSERILRALSARTEPEGSEQERRQQGAGFPQRSGSGVGP